MKIITQEIFDPCFKQKKVRVFMRRLDLISSKISGNKFFKLKYNIEYAIKSKYRSIITFGGAYSNHILATSIISKKEFSSLSTMLEPAPISEIFEFPVKFDNAKLYTLTFLFFSNFFKRLLKYFSLGSKA